MLVNREKKFFIRIFLSLGLITIFACASVAAFATVGTVFDSTRSLISCDVFGASKQANHVYIVCTSALINQSYELRKSEYTASFLQLKQFGYIPYIVESLATPPTFFDQYAIAVKYTHTNNALLRNKGVNEALALREAFKSFPFEEDAIVIKMTGRYFLDDDTALRFIENSGEFDVFVKCITNEQQVFTGFIAMRVGLFKELLDSINYELMEKEMINIEKIFFDFIKGKEKKQLVKCFYLEKISLIANIFGDGNCQLTYW